MTRHGSSGPGPVGNGEDLGAPSGYYQAIAKEFLRRRGAPFMLSPRDLSVIAEWEKKRVPLDVVLEGIGRAFDGLRDRSRGTKGLGLAFCRVQVDRALAQHVDRGAGRHAAPPPRAGKKDRALKEAVRFLEASGERDAELGGRFRAAVAALSSPAPDEDLLEKIDGEVDAVLAGRAEEPDRKAAAREASRLGSGASAEDAAEAVRTRLAKLMRERGRVPYVSLFYY
jgi:hypothetical protein